MAQIKRNSAPMAGIHFQIDCAPVKFFSASNYLCDQTRANTAPAPLGQNIEFFQPPADSTVLKAKQATRICDTHHGTDFIHASQHNESVTRVGDNVLNDQAQVVRRCRNTMFLELSAEKSNSAINLPSGKKGDTGTGHWQKGWKNHKNKIRDFSRFTVRSSEGFYLLRDALPSGLKIRS